MSKAMLAAADKTFWMPEQASTFAPQIDPIFNYITWVAVIFFILIAGLMFWFAVAYRRPAGVPATGTTTHHTGLELLWSVLPSLLMIPMFWWGFTVFMDTRVAPHGAYTINVEGQRWQWFFTYPNGIQVSDLHIPVNQPVELVMKSADVLHSLFVPAFRIKQDVIPERYTRQWVKAIRPGEYYLLCTEYCGTNHSTMTANVTVHPEGEFEDWLEKADPLKGMTDEQWGEYSADPEAFIKQHPEIVNLLPPAEMGRLTYTRKGCSQCHTIDGKGSTGPTFQGLWMRDEHLASGEVVKADENYIRESILDPARKVVRGFNPVMPTFQGKVNDREITVLIEYIKTLK